MEKIKTNESYISIYERQDGSMGAGVFIKGPSLEKDFLDKAVQPWVMPWQNVDKSFERLQVYKEVDGNTVLLQEEWKDNEKGREILEPFMPNIAGESFITSFAHDSEEKELAEKFVGLANAHYLREVGGIIPLSNFTETEEIELDMANGIALNYAMSEDVKEQYKDEIAKGFENKTVLPMNEYKNVR